MTTSTARQHPDLTADQQRVVVGFLLDEAGLPVAPDELDELLPVFALVRAMVRPLNGWAAADELT